MIRFVVPEGKAAPSNPLRGSSSMVELRQVGKCPPEVWVVLHDGLQASLDVTLVLLADDVAQVFPHIVEPLVGRPLQQQHLQKLILLQNKQKGWTVTSWKCHSELILADCRGFRVRHAGPSG